MADIGEVLSAFGFARPPRDPRDPSVKLTATADLPDPPRDLFPNDPEAPASGLRLHLAEEAGYDATTEEQMRTLDASEALHRLVDDVGLDQVYRLLKLIAIGRGRQL